ncbi:MAG: energy transducer TonB, partial [Bacteroidia bacterium]|nr:energy transducer TonB [Bacteroidia bacterium]
QANEILSKTVSREKGKSEATKKTETIPVEEKDVDYYKVEDKMAAPAAAMIKQEPVQAVLDDSLVVIGYGDAERAKAEAAAGKVEFDQSGYLPPQPVNGKDSFDKYIEENIRKPATLGEGEKAIVVISFLVKNTGAIDSIKVLRSPGNEFSEEAKRLIMDGPKWKPAESNRVKIDDEIRLRIIFK